MEGQMTATLNIAVAGLGYVGEVIADVQTARQASKTSAI